MSDHAELQAKQWDRRIERAGLLASQYSFARELLVFYAELTIFQKGLYLDLHSSCAPEGAEKRYSGPPKDGASAPPRRRPNHKLLNVLGERFLAGLKPRPSRARLNTFSEACTAAGNDGVLPLELERLNLSFLMPRFPSFLSMLERKAPAALGGFARALADRGPDAWTQVLASVHCRDEPEPSSLASFERFCSRAFLQPTMEYLARRASLTPPAVRLPICPFCGSKPVVGVLRPEGEGAKRSLICALCRTEWDYVRLTCPACEESREERLCVYTTPQFEHVRVEACGTCRAYLKTIDLTRSGLAVPEVDELAAVPLTLWADEHGYRKLTRNVLGL